MFPIPKSNKTDCGIRAGVERTEHNIWSILSCLRCHIIQSTTYVVRLTLVDLRIEIPMAYLHRLLTSPLTIVLLNLRSLHVARWTDVGIMLQFTTSETTIGMNWHDWIVRPHWCTCCIAWTVFCWLGVCCIYWLKCWVYWGVRGNCWFVW